MPEHICVCEDGYYEVVNTEEDKSNTCEQCKPGCAICKSNTECLSCVAQSTDNGDGSCTCAAGSFFTISSNGVRYCTACPANCDSCDSTLTCAKCASGFILTTAEKCICPKNNYIVPVTNKCIACKSGCEVCDSTTTCEKCIPPLVLENDNCDINCSPGFYLAGVICVGCPEKCVECTNTNQCYYCEDGYYLHSGSCYAVCPAGTVPNSNTFKCTPCNFPCKTCTNHPSSCTSCEPG